MSARMLTGSQITPALHRELNLPDGTWQLVLNHNMTAAAFMDRAFRVHHLSIDDLKWLRVQSALAGRLHMTGA